MFVSRLNPPRGKLFGCLWFGVGKCRIFESINLRIRNRKNLLNNKHQMFYRPCSTMDSTRVSEALNPGSIPGEATQREFWSICAG